VKGRPIGPFQPTPSFPNTPAPPSVPGAPMKTERLALCLLLSLSTLLGCGEDTDTPPKGDDTGETDADTDADADTDTDTDTDTDPAAGDFTVRVQPDLEKMAVGLYPMDPGSSTFEDLSQSTPIDGESVSLRVGSPASSELVSFDEREPDLLGRAWMLAMFHDDNGDGEMAGGLDRITGFAQVVVLYVEGEPGEALAAEGYMSGWNVRAYYPQGGISPDGNLDPGAITLAQNLVFTESLRVGGSYDLALDSSTLSIMVSSIADVRDGDPVETTIDHPLEIEDGAWGLTLRNEPPEAHYGQSGIHDNAAAQAIYVYETSGSGSYADGDALVAMACHEGQRILPVHIRPAVTPEQALEYAGFGLSTGWSLWVGTEKGLQPAEMSVATILGISEACL
jgi:hypothetical protein